MNNNCPICGDVYNDLDRKIEYHFSYKPQITTYACDGCNYAEYLIRHPDIPRPNNILHRIEVVRQWTLKNRSLIL